MTANAPPPSETGPTGHAGGPTAVDRDGVCRIERLRVYPLKGGAGAEVETMTFDEVGPENDRRWMVVRPDGTFITQRQEPRLALIRALPETGGLSLSAPGTGDLSVETPSGANLRVQVWASSVDAAGAGRAADAWLTDLLGYEARLAHLPMTSVRNTNPEFAPGARVSFADGYPALLVTGSSVDELSRRAGRRMEIERFRPNLVVGPARPHAEDRWRQITVGAMAFRGVKLCARCTVTTVDQATGARHPDGEPLRTLARYRNIEGKVFFGLNVVHAGPGTIRLYDPVQVVERGSVPVG